MSFDVRPPAERCSAKAVVRSFFHQISSACNSVLRIYCRILNGITQFGQANSFFRIVYTKCRLFFAQFVLFVHLCVCVCAVNRIACSLHSTRVPFPVLCIFCGTKELTSENSLIYWHLHTSTTNQRRKTLLNFGKCLKTFEATEQQLL